MIIKINYIYEYRPKESYYKHHITSEILGNFVCEITGQGNTENEALCGFENNVLSLFRNIFPMIDIDIDDDDITIEMTKINDKQG